MDAILAVLLLAAVVAVVSKPLRRDAALGPPAAADTGALEAAREAKLREILDTELDYRTGKLSEPHYRDIDQTLRAEAIELTRRQEDER